MPDSLNAPSPAAKAIALGLKEVLRRTLAALVDEAGPDNALLREVVDTARQLFAPLQIQFLQHARSGMAEQECTALRAAFDAIFDKVLTRLDKAVIEVDAKAVRRRLDACSRVGRELRAQIDETFGLRAAGSIAPTAPIPFAVVKVDLVGYEGRIKSLPEARRAVGDVGVVRVLGMVDKAIRDHSVDAIRALGPDHRPERHFLRIEGDAIVLRFDAVRDAVRFADALAEEACRHSITSALAEPYRYRVGVAFGQGKCAPNSDVALCPEMSGLPFIWAARMESQCKPGGVILHESAWLRLLGEHGLAADAPIPPENAFLARFVADTIEVKGETYSAFVFVPPAS